MSFMIVIDIILRTFDVDSWLTKVMFPSCSVAIMLECVLL